MPADLRDIKPRKRIHYAEEEYYRPSETPDLQEQTVPRAGQDRSSANVTPASSKKKRKLTPLQRIRKIMFRPPPQSSLPSQGIVAGPQNTASCAKIGKPAGSTRNNLSPQQPRINQEEAKMDTNTPLDSVQRKLSATSQADEEEEVVIQLTHQDTEPWDSDQDSIDSQGTSTSTPAYKRGRHTLPPQDIADLITIEGIDWGKPKYVKKRLHPSMLILADSQFGQWPWNDKICDLYIRPQASLTQWTSGHPERDH